MSASVRLALCLCGLKGVVPLLAPSFVSVWYYVSIPDENELEKEFYHNFGVYPVKAEVQVKAFGDDFIFPGISIAQAEDNGGIKAGVACYYNKEKVVLVAPKGGGSYLINTGGEDDWTGDNRERRREGLVRVRLWHPDDFPPPTFNQSYNVSSSGSDNTWTIAHGGDVMPEYAIVKGKTPDGWMFEAVGSNMQDSSTTEWGTLLSRTNDIHIRVDALMNDTHGYLFRVLKGWGDNSDDKWLEYDTIEVSAWTSLLPSTKICQSKGTLDVKDDLENNEFTTSVFDAKTDFITVVAKVIIGSKEYDAMGTGAAMSNDDEDSAGLVYAYNAVTSMLRLWHPKASNAAIIRIGPNMKYNFNASKIETAEAIICIWRVGQISTTSTSTTTTASTTTTTPTSTSKTTPPPTTTTSPTTTTTPQSTTTTTQPTTTTTQPTTTTPPLTTTTTQPTTTPTTTPPLTTTTTQSTTTTTQPTTTTPPPTTTTTQPTTTSTTTPPPTTTTSPPTKTTPPLTTTTTQPTTTTTQPTTTTPPLTTTTTQPTTTKTQPTTTIPPLTTTTTQPTTTSTTTMTTTTPTTTSTTTPPPTTTTPPPTTTTPPPTTTTSPPTTTTPPPTTTTTQPTTTKTQPTTTILSLTTTTTQPTTTPTTTMTTTTTQPTTTTPPLTTTTTQPTTTTTQPFTTTTPPTTTTTKPTTTSTTTMTTTTPTTTSTTTEITKTETSTTTPTTTYTTTAPTTTETTTTVTTTSPPPPATETTTTMTTTTTPPTTTETTTKMTTTTPPATTETTTTTQSTTETTATTETTSTPTTTEPTTTQCTTETTALPSTTEILSTPSLTTTTEASDTTAPLTTTNHSYPCQCPIVVSTDDKYGCSLMKLINTTEAMERAERLIEELILPPKDMTKYTRTLTCATDKRSSSKVVGALGLIIMVTYGVVLILPDTINIVQYVLYRYNMHKETVQLRGILW